MAILKKIAPKSSQLKNTKQQQSWLGNTQQYIVNINFQQSQTDFDTKIKTCIKMANRKLFAPNKTGAY